MLPTRQSLTILVQRSFQLGSKCAYSGSYNQGRNQGLRETEYQKAEKQGERNLKDLDTTNCYVQNLRKNRVQIFRVQNPKIRWADFCNRMIYKDPV